uniref:Uncharacterized protein n=1 Tax=Mycena chlorophos TaxID=658473 RepID=A0ABQ0KXN5_MYCCL|nr:predicted protein [Mycena chlorophos]
MTSPSINIRLPTASRVSQALSVPKSYSPAKMHWTFEMDFKACYSVPQIVPTTSLPHEPSPKTRPVSSGISSLQSSSSSSCLRSSMHRSTPPRSPKVDDAVALFSDGGHPPIHSIVDSDCPRPIRLTRTCRREMYGPFWSTQRRSNVLFFLDIGTRDVALRQGAF